MKKTEKSSEQKLSDCFVDSLGLEAGSITDSLGYNTIPQWDSIGHMALIAEMEKVFDVTLDTDDIISMSTVKKAKEILGKYGVSFNAAKK
jgi:acyl carrier protein